MSAEGEAFVKGTGDLALEFADAPLVGGGFDFVEPTFLRGFDGEEFDVVGPAEGEAADEIFHRFDEFRCGQMCGGQFNRRCRFFYQ